MERADIRQVENDLEMRVSHYIGTMPFLWLNVDDAAGSESERSIIERNSIALLNSYLEPAVYPPSADWLGRYSNRVPVQRSGLWNNHYVDKSWDPSFLDAMERWVERTDPG